MIFSFIFLTLSWVSLVLAQDYREQLHIQPLPNNALLASFNFKANTSLADFESQNFRFFPRSLAQILQHTRTKELHLRFSTGGWDPEAWGIRPWKGSKEGGTGVELWAWVDSSSEEEAFSRWNSLTNLLSGLFCASINFIDATKTISPIWTFDMEGTLPRNQTSDLRLLHGTLPHEVVCTENLTPFLKLLPCKGKAGIASLVDGHRLFDAFWQTMSLDVRPLCPSGGDECIFQFEQTIDMVLDIDRTKRPRDRPIPHPIDRALLECDTTKHYNSHDTCFPLQKPEEPPISLEAVFGVPIRGHCSPEPGDASGSQVCVKVPAERLVSVLRDGVGLSLDADCGRTRCFGLKDSVTTDIDLPAQVMKTPLSLTPSPLLARRDITGYGAQIGGVQAVFRNPTASPVSIVYLESLPWFMRPYLSTLEARVFRDSLVNSSPHPFIDRHFRLARDRVRGTHLELILEVPPESSVAVSYQFDKALLRYTEYPPDANRGFDVPPAVIRVLPRMPVGKAEGEDSERVGGSAPRSEWSYVRTTSLLLPLPTPDFSMPYNVIIFTSTVIALGFGGVFNLLTRRAMPPQASSAGLLGTVKARFVQKFSALLFLFGGKKDP